MTIFDILIICAISFVLKEANGPWIILSRIRSTLFNRGPAFSRIFFFGLLSCWFCVGFWSGILNIVVSSHHLTFVSFFQWGLSGGTISLLFGGVYGKLFEE